MIAGGDEDAAALVTQRQGKQVFVPFSQKIEVVSQTLAFCRLNQRGAVYCDCFRQRSTTFPDGTVPVGNNVEKKGQHDEAGHDANQSHGDAGFRV